MKWPDYMAELDHEAELKRFHRRLINVKSMITFYMDKWGVRA
ncbi:MAG: hypothetical protein OES46_18990 [Gammaproteobacteria bacterium]|jgi:hypothetical protein|nr:hypothetical protein [Gammaproteobacteria bacterium]